MVSRISVRGVLAVVAAAAVSLTCSEGTGPDPKIQSIVVTPTLDTLRSLGEQLTLSVVAYIGSRVYDGGEYTWERSDTAVLFLTGGVPTSRSRTVTARRNGSTFVRVREAGGASDSARVVVRQRVARFVTFAGASSVAYRACPLPAGVLPLDARGNVVADAVLHWRSSDPTLARVDSTGLITPLAVGTDTISVTADTASFRFAISIEVAPVMPLYLSGVGGEAVVTVGRAQYAIGQGKIGGAAVAMAPARFRIVSSDTSVAAVTPADTTLSPFYPFFSEPLRVVGRSVGEVTLTPYLCDVPGPPITLRVTRPHLTLINPLPANARTDEDATSVVIYTQDSAGVTHYPAEPLTVRVTTTDPTVMRSDSSYRHVGVGSQGFIVTVSYLEPGSARLVVEDSAGVYVPDSSGLVQIAYPPLGLVGDTLHLGMRQHAFPAWDPRYVYVDRIVAGAPLHVSLSSSDGTVAQIAPASVDIPVGSNAVTVDITSGDTRGIATLTAQANRRTDARSVIVVGRPAVQVSQIGGIFYPGDVGLIQVITADSATAVPRIAAEPVTFTIASSDPAVLSVDPGTLTMPAGNATSPSATVTFKQPGTAVITASDPRGTPYSYAPGSSPPLTVAQPSLVADSVLSLGREQSWGFGVVINGRLPEEVVVRVAHRNPAVATLADTLAAHIIPSFAAVLATGIAGGVDSVIATAPGFRSDTGIIVVGTGTSEVVTWPPFGLTVGQSWPLTLHVLGPNGDPRASAVTKTFALTVNDNIEFIQDGAPITTVTVAAGQQSSLQFSVRGTAAGTGTVTISASNYSSITKSVTVGP
jgi:Big-like domain-containing protein